MALKDSIGEKELIKKIVDGDEQAFSVIFFKYLPVLQSFALKFSKSADATEEIIQDAFVRVWLNRDKLSDVENVKAYLYKYVSNECLTFLRKKIRAEKVSDIYKIKNPDHTTNTSDTINLNEINRIVAKAVNKLPNQRRKIYQLSRSDGKTIPEIAEILDISPSTVKNALVTALKEIRQELHQHGITLFLLILQLFIK